MATNKDRARHDLTHKQSLNYAEDLTRTYRELRKRIDELEVLNKKKNDFLVMASHEIRTPITKISLLVDFIEARLGAIITEENPAQEGLRKTLKELKKTAWSLHVIMSEVISAAEQGLKEVPYHFIELNINSLITELSNEMAPFLAKRRQKIITEFDAQDLVVNADRARLADVLFNIVQNASRFSEDGKDVHIRTREKEDMAVIEIEDHGIGIEKTKLEAIFTPFYEDVDIMAHQSGDFEFKSSRLGMGLYIAKGIIEAHGGRINVESTPGKGSIFSIFLPGHGNKPLNREGETI